MPRTFQRKISEQKKEKHKTRTTKRKRKAKNGVSVDCSASGNGTGTGASASASAFPFLLGYFFMSIYIFKTNAIGLLHINKRDQPVKFAVRERMKNTKNAKNNQTNVIVGHAR